MENRGLEIDPSCMVSAAVEFPAQYEAQAAYEAVGVILVHLCPISGGVVVTPEVMVRELYLGFDAPATAQGFLPAVFGAQAHAPVLEFPVVTVGCGVVGIDAAHPGDEVQVMAMGTDVGAVEGQVRFFLGTVAVGVVRIAPEVGNGAAVVPAAVVFCVFLLIVAHLDGLVIAFEAVAAVPFQVLIHHAGPDAVVLLVIAQFAKTFGVSLVFVTIIVMIERQILLAIHPTKMLATFRFVIAIVMAVVGSTIFDQTMFGKDIDKQMADTIEQQTVDLTQKRVVIIESKLNAIHTEKDSLDKLNTEMKADINAHPWILQKSVTNSQEKLVVNGKIKTVNNPSVTTN